MKLKIPTELKDITLEQVQRVLLIDRDDAIEPFAKKVHSVAIMTGRSAREIGQVKFEDLDNIYNRIFDMINGRGDAPLRQFIKIQGHEFAFIEDVRDMETGAFVDIDQMTKEDKYAENLHRIMAVLYRPIDAKLGNRYRLKSYAKEDPKQREERAALFLKYMTFDVVRGAAGFFLLVTQKCCGILDGSFPVLETLKAMKVATRGAGTTLFTQ